MHVATSTLWSSEENEWGISKPRGKTNSHNKFKILQDVKKKKKKEDYLWSNDTKSAYKLSCV